MPDTSSKQAPLSDIILASARNVRAVLAGRSLSDSLAETPAALRAATQAVSFHAMRKLGLARGVKRILVQRTPPNPLFDAVLLVSLALLDTALEYADGEPDGALRHLPRYAVHTVVDQAVSAVDGQKAMRAYKALLNGSLRRYIRERPVILAQALENDEAMFNHPDWWVAQLQLAYPDQWRALLQASDLPGPMSLRVNTRRATMEQVQGALDAAGIQAVKAGENALVLAEARPVQAVPGFQEGWWSVQDLAAQQAGALLPLQDGMRVLDACAAPGGKTAHMLERAQVELLALDSDSSRLARVGENLARLRLDGPRVSLLCADAADLASWWDGRPFDAVLADVPCTASGVVRRHPDIRWLRRQADVGKTAALQRKIVDALWQTVKPGGHLLYATCSVFPQEGERQAAQFPQRHKDAARLPAPGQLLPRADGSLVSHDGFFYALFAKTA
ncbi:MAG: 16S rRNA (cytosine(967)-C(5))-methyltransferase RsmB [Burkholderiaceae bacterium]